MNKLFPNREDTLGNAALKRTLKKELKKPIKKYEDYQFIAGIYNTLSEVEKAIQIMQEAVQNKQFSNEELGSGYIYLGFLYTDMEENSKASDYFHKGLNLMSDENFKYDGAFKEVIELFIKNNDNERAEFWLNNLLQRQSYDKKFKKLDVLRKEWDYAVGNWNE
ncbi:tetratricopeptide repeat protein [Chengkuizengella marina]|uniref:Uncharacterized protein n=1 Tax=Chengkuizengella marina TaxID=2507566 RepID=A0A6N9PYP4_9BACL|nr:hypothetical protein [Chengkuizengella marina]NBI28641.1 hypothetical protein [Chengkuizengella marina]